jgi:hypothetical protein
MIPDTAGAVLSFLGLIAPGLVFELLRERRRPAVTETAFREASRVALTSLVFTLAALAVLSAVRTVWPSRMPDPRRWLELGSRYVGENYRLIAFGLALEVGIACGLAVLSDVAMRWFGLGRADIRPGSIWYRVLRDDRPKDATVWVNMRLTDGTRIVGYLLHYTPGEKVEDREIALTGRFIEVALPGKDYAPLGKSFDALMVAGDRISFIAIVYGDEKAGNFVRKDGTVVGSIPRVAAGSPTYPASNTVASTAPDQSAGTGGR